MKLSVFYDHIIQAQEQTGKDIDTILKYVKNCGIEALEIRLSHLQEDDKVAEKIRQAGLSVSCIFEFYEMGKADETAKIKAHLDMAQKLSAPNIMIVPGFLEGEDVDRLKEYMKDEAQLYSFFDSNDEVKRMAEGMNKAVSMGRNMGITVLFEDFDDFSSPMSGINGVSWFLDKCPDVGFTFDCGNFIMHDEDVIYAYNKFFPRIKHVHCKDRSTESIPVGDGRIPIKEVVTRLIESGYDGYFAIEHFDAKDQMGCIGKSAHYLVGLLQRWICMVIETERLILRPFQKDDAEDVFEYLKMPAVNCFADMKLSSLEEAREEVRNRSFETEYYFAIVLKETGKVIGEIEAYPEPADEHGASTEMDTFSPCWMLNKSYHGKGYAYEAACAFFDYLFKDKGARRIYAYTEDYNKASQHLCEKLGMRQEGLFKEFISFVKNPDGTPHYENTYQYAILKKEWEDR